MSAEVIQFRKRIEPDIKGQTANRHALLAMDLRDALLGMGDGAAYVEHACLFAAIEGAVQFLQIEHPHWPDELIARKLGRVFLDYCRTRLGASE